MSQTPSPDGRGKMTAGKAKARTEGIVTYTKDARGL